MRVASQDRPASAAPRSPSALSISNPQARKCRRLHPLHRDPEVHAQVQSPDFSLPSCFRLKKKKKNERRGAQRLGEESEGSRSTARVGFVRLLPPPSGARRNPLGPGRDTLCERMTFEARGRRSSPGALFCSNPTHMSASSLHSSGAKSSRRVKHRRRAAQVQTAACHGASRPTRLRCREHHFPCLVIF